VKTFVRIKYSMVYVLS